MFNILDLLISNAEAQTTTAAATAGADFLQFLPIVLMFVVVYFMMIRPQQKKAKEHQAMTSALQKGDEVVTQSGIAGKISKVGDNFIAVEIAEGTTVQVQKSAVGALLPKGTLKSL